MSSEILVESNGVTRHDKDGSPFQVRDFKYADFDDLIAFYTRFEPKRVAQGLPPGDRDRIVAWLGAVLAGDIHKLAFRDGALIGHAFITATTKAGVGEYAVFLDQDLRGRGVGTELNREVVDTARRRGMKGLWLTVEPHNRAAIRSYEKVGFGFVGATVYSTEVEMEILF